MSIQLKRRRDTATNVAAYAGAQGELIVDLTNNRVTVHDGVTPGGWAAAKLSEVASASRTAVVDMNYTALITDRAVAYTLITAARSVTLPAVSAFPTGAALLIMDESGAATTSKTINLIPNGSDLINGAANAAINSAYGYLVLQGNGAASPFGRWTIVAQAGSNLPNIGVGAPSDPNNALSVYGSSALFNGVSFNVTVNKATAGNTASILFQDGFSGRAQVGLAGDDNFHFKVSANGSTWLEALDINASTGQPSFPQGIASGEAVGFRNRLRNAAFAINQRNVSGTVTLVAGAYGHDGVRAGAAGATYTFAASGLDTTITVSAGSLILPIESSMIEGGAYMLSQAGAAQARVWQGSGYSGTGAYASAPFAVTGLSAATQTNVEFSTGAILRPQFEPGSVATVFERRPINFEIALCQRYCVAFSSQFIGAATTGTITGSVVYFPVQMRSVPAMTPGASFASTSGSAGTPAINMLSTGSAQIYNSSGSWSVGAAITFSGVLQAEL